MLPGKIYTPEDILTIARKRIWFVVLPLAIVSAGTAVWVRQLPNLYRSDAAILVVPQRVPESYVRSTVTTRIEDRLQSIQQQILSRTKLEQIITEFNLYEKELKTGIMEDVVQRMRIRDIRSDVLRGDAFRISFQGEDPRTVMRVTERLASLFISENVVDRSRMAENTNSFLESQLEEAKQRLVEQEKKLEAYKLQHAGQLPTQLESNLQGQQALQAQLQNTMQVVERERDHLTRLERDIADLEQQIEDGAPVVGAAPSESDSQSRQLASMREALSAMQLTRRDDHPDVRRLKAAITEMEQKVDGTPKASATDDTPVTPKLSGAELARRRRLDDMKLELARVKRNLENGEREQARLRKDIGVYQARNEAIPTRETEMTELLRDYATHNKLYTDLLAKREDSKMASSLENRQIGEQFKMIDPARIPERPFSPDRTRFNAMGAAGGLLIGLLLVALLEYRDKSFKTDADVTRVLTLPVLAVVPMMRSAAEQKRQFRNQLVMGLGFGTTVLACVAVVAYTLVR